MFLIFGSAISFVVQLMKRHKVTGKKKNEKKYLYDSKVCLYLCSLNNIFISNVFDFRFNSQFHSSIDDSIQESQKPQREKGNCIVI
jgi:hypothetical protein